MPALKLYLMGHFHLTLHEQPLDAFRSQRTRALLAYLAVEHVRPLQRTRLAHLLWDGYDSDAARTNLRVSLSNIRQLLGPFDLIHATYHTVQFDVTRTEFWCDVLALEAMTGAPQLGNALSLSSEVGPRYKREFLEDLDDIDSPPFQAWLKTQRVRYRQLLEQLDPRGGQALLAPLLKGALRRLAGPLEPQLDESNEPSDGAMGAIRNLPGAIGVATAPMLLNQAPEVAFFHGREHELTRLDEWLRDARYRLIMILGMGGQGKTALAAHCANAVAMQRQDHQSDGDRNFSHILWQSLVNAPPLAEVLESWLKPLSGQAEGPAEGGVDQQLDRLFPYLQQHRCLLVLDNLESLLTAGERAGHFRAGYEEYGYFLEQFATRPHQSCLLLTSREEPQRLKVSALGSRAVQSLRLAGLSPAAGHSLLQELGLAGEPALRSRLVERYSGNPLALKLVAATISDLFGGQIAQFLAEESLVFDDIRDILDQQFARLLPVEVAVLKWLAVEREPIPFDTVCEDLIHSASRRAIIEAIRSLQRRMLLEQYDDHFGLQNVILEYTTDQVVDQVCQAIEQGATMPVELLLQSALNEFALVKAQAKEYVRQSQERLLLRPVATWLTGHWSKTRFVDQAQCILRRLQQAAPLAPGYTGANLLHLLLYLRVDLRGCDFSRLTLWQADLRESRLPQVNFTQADLTHSTFVEPFETIRSLAFTADGLRLVGGAYNGNLHIWRLAERQPERMLRGHQGVVYSVALYTENAAGPQLLASASADQTVRLWDLETGELYCVLRGHGSEVMLVAFDAKGEKLISVGQDGVSRIWMVKTLLNQLVCDQPHTLFGGTHTPMYHAAASPDGSWVAAGGDSKIVHCWDVESGQLRASLQDNTDEILDLIFSPDGATLAISSGDQTIRLWTLADPPPDRPGAPPSFQVRDRLPELADQLAFSSDSTLLASGYDQQISLWAVGTTSGRGDLRLRMTGHTGRISALAFSPDGATLASASYDQTLQLWNVQTGQAEHKLFGQARAVELVRFSPDGATLISTHFDHTVHVWSQDGRQLHALHGHQEVVRHVAFSLPLAGARPLLATGGNGKSIHIWDMQSGEHRFSLRRHTSSVTSLVFSPVAENARVTLVSGGGDAMVYLWNADTDEASSRLEGHANQIKFIAFNPVGSLLATASGDQTTRIWEMPSGHLRHVLQEHTGMVRFVAFHPDGRLLASASDDTTICLWDVVEGRVCQLLQGHTQAVVKVLFTGDGQTLVSASDDQTLRIWSADASTGAYRLAHIIPQAIYKHDCVTLSRDSITLVSGGVDGTVRLWDLRTGRLRQALSGHTNLITSVDVSPDGRLAASGCSDGMVRIWDAQTGECLHMLQPEGPYAGMNITGATGITEAQKEALLALGAITR
jgi:WD40 repeat protein